MSADLRQAAETGGADRGGRYIVTARWDGDRWAVSLPNPRGGRTAMVAANLAEAARSVSEVLAVLLGCWPGSAPGDVGLEVHVDPALTERLETARDSWEAAEVLRGGGLREVDITAIMLARVVPAWPPAIDAGQPVEVHHAGETRLDEQSAVTGRDGTEGP